MFFFIIVLPSFIIILLSLFSYSFRCEEGQKMKKDNLKFSINETSFSDD